MQIPQNDPPNPTKNKPTCFSWNWWVSKMCKILADAETPMKWPEKNQEMLIPNEDRLITVLLPNLPQKPSQGTFEIEMFNKCFVGFSSWCFLSRRIWCIWVGLADQRSLFWCIITSKHNAAKYFWKRFYSTSFWCITTSYLWLFRPQLASMFPTKIFLCLWRPRKCFVDSLPLKIWIMNHYLGSYKP